MKDKICKDDRIVVTFLWARHLKYLFSKHIKEMVRSARIWPKLKEYLKIFFYMTNQVDKRQMVGLNNVTNEVEEYNS